MENTSRYTVGDLVVVGPGRAPGRIVAPWPLPGGGQTYDVVLDRLLTEGWSEEEATVRGVCEHWLAPAGEQSIPLDSTGVRGMEGR